MENLWLMVVAALLAVIAVAGVVALRRTAAQRDEVVRALQHDLRSLCNAAVGMGERVNQMERRLRQLAERQEALGLRQDQLNQEDPEARTYSQAIKMAHKGAGVDDLVEVCGLSRGEAELVAMMHRLGKE
jgi:signal transduction histidine kinase